MAIKMHEAARAVQSIMGSEDGQVLVHYLIERYGYTRRPMIGEGAPLEYCEGQRSVMVHLGVLIDADPLQLKAMETEHND